MGERVPLAEGSNQQPAQRGRCQDAPPRIAGIDHRATGAPSRLADPERRGKKLEAVGVFLCGAQLTVHGVHGALALYSESPCFVWDIAAANRAS